jgi:8-oxo-dGTP pyrophosphatase MutT (NUDIX family)
VEAIDMSWEEELHERLQAEAFTKGLSNHYHRLVADNAYHTCEECGFAVGKYPGRYGRFCSRCGADFYLQHTFPKRPKVMDSIMGDPARTPQTTQGLPAMPAIGEDEDEEVTESESLPQPELVEIVDTREFDWETGKPIPGSGKPNFCGRCSKAHEVHWIVRDEHGKLWTVGASCAKLVWNGWQPAPELVKSMEKAAEAAMHARETGKRDAVVVSKIAKAEVELINTFPGYTTETVDYRGKIYLTRDNKTFVTKSDLAVAAKPKDAVRILIKKWVRIRAVELLRAVRPKLTKEEIDSAVKTFADSVVPVLVGKTAVTEKLTPVAVDKCGPLELEAGIATEMEHTDSKEEASVIARQHLSEDPHYYRKLFKAKILKKDEVGEEVWDKISDTWTEAGKAVCAWCGKDLGDRPELKDGDVTHGICQACSDRILSGRGKSTKTEVAIREMLGGSGGAASSTTEPPPGDTMTPSGPHSANTQQKEMASVDSQSTTTPVAPTGNFQGSGAMESMEPQRAWAEDPKRLKTMVRDGAGNSNPKLVQLGNIADKLLQIIKARAAHVQLPPSKRSLPRIAAWNEDIRKLEVELTAAYSQMTGKKESVAEDAPKPAGSELALKSLVAALYTRYPVLQKWKVRWVYVEKQVGGHEAELVHGQVKVYPKLFSGVSGDLPKIHVLVHEIGHFALSELGWITALSDVAQKVGVDVWETPKLPYGVYNSDEAFAECFAAYYTDRSHLLTHHPAWAKIVAHMVEGKPLTEAKATCTNCGASVSSTDMRGGVCRKCASEMVRPDSIPSTAQKTEAVSSSPKLISIEDTRDLDFDTGKRIPGSGIFKDCARCSRPHQIYYSVQDKDGKIWSVGSGCCKQFFAGWEPTADEIRVAKQKALELKNAALKAKESTLQAEWTAEIRKQVASIQRPRVSPVGHSKWGHTPQDFDYSTSDGVLTSMIAKSRGESFESLSLDARSSFWTEWAAEVVSSVWERMGYGKMIPKSFDAPTLRHKVLSPVTQELLHKLRLSEAIRVGTSSWISEFVNEVMEAYCCEGTEVKDTVPEEDGGRAFTAACSIIIRDKTEVLLGLAVTEDDRNGTWCFPGGGVDPEDGGDVLAAARREAYEETGCDVRPTGTVLAHPDKPDVAFVVTEYVSGSCEPNREFAELQWVTFGAIDQFPDIYPINKQVLQRVPSGQLGV